MRLILAPIIVCLLCWGCNSQKQQIRKLDALSIGQPIEFARLSNLLNPCFTGKAKSDTVNHTDTVTIAGATTTNTVYVKGNGDTIIKTLTITLPGKIINHTVTIHDTLADNRALTVAINDYSTKRDSLIIRTTQFNTASDTASKWRLWCLLTWGAIVLIVAGKILWTIYGGTASTLISKI